MVWSRVFPLPKERTQLSHIYHVCTARLVVMSDPSTANILACGQVRMCRHEGGVQRGPDVVFVADEAVSTVHLVEDMKYATERWPVVAREMRCASIQICDPPPVVHAV